MSEGIQFIHEINKQHAHIIYESAVKVNLSSEESIEVHAEVMEEILSAKDYEKLSSDSKLLRRRIAELADNTIKISFTNLRTKSIAS